MGSPAPQVLTVSLNPALDLRTSCAGFHPGALNRASHLVACPGGKGINVAAALASYGHAVAAAGFIGTENSAPFQALFSDKGIRDEMLRIEGSTRTCIKIADPTTGKTTEINGPGLAVPEEALAELTAKLSLIPCQWVALSGSLPPGIPTAFYAELIGVLRGSGRKVLLDTSGPALPAALAAQPQVIKPNLEEFQALLGRPCSGSAEIVAAARSLLGNGLELVVVSMAQEGACFVTQDAALLAHAPCPQPASTVGAGDAMVAGILSSLLEGLPIEALARRATAFALLWLRNGGHANISAVSEIAGSASLKPL